MRRLWRPALDRLTPYEAGPSLEALRAQLGLAEVTRLSANENPLGPSPPPGGGVRAEAPPPLPPPPPRGVPADAVILGNGADELLGLIAWAALEAGDEAVIPHPAFEPYWTVVTLAGATPVASPLVDYRTDLEDMARRVTPRTKVVILCSPHNPAGTIIHAGAFRRFAERLGSDPPLLVLDEAYRDFVDDPEI